MKPKLSLHNRAKLLKKALHGEQISKLCREAGVSRTVFYRWLARYKEKTGFQNLSQPEKKVEFFKASVMPKKGSVLHRPRYEVVTRIRAIEDVLHKKIPVTQVCRDLHISKTIFYKWLKKYKTAGTISAVPQHILETKPDAVDTNILTTALPEQISPDAITPHVFDEHRALSALEDKKPQITRFHNQVKEEYEALILNAVSEYPELSSHQLVKVLPMVGSRPVVGHHGVQNVLRRHDLNTYEKRLAFTKTHKSTPFVFNFSIKSFLSILSSIARLPFHTRNRLLAGLTAFSLPVGLSVIMLGFWNYLLMYAQAPSLSVGIGYIFASAALFLGTFFLLYSFKYYISVSLVLIFSRHSLHKEGKEIKGNLTGNALVPDVSDVTLDRHPFVSIHLPLYNEKRVVNRLLEAVTSMNYENFEVIVCDDSTDETKNIVLEWKNHPRVKISHRDSRVGFKGAALGEALKIMDKRAEFVLVFDADFLPYPDSIEQFLRYFKVLTGSLEQKNYAKSNIAALQGYQWHVLNKSENWITRGVRSEYAGSYVIERSSAEIYGGLKQIAGSVYMIRTDVLKQFGWGNSITEDFELTLRLYAAGFKVAYTPYLQSPSECVSTIKRLVRQRMRWAEGHSYNIKRMFTKVLLSPQATPAEKLELAYLSPYYLQSAFFLAGTLAWFIAEAVFRVRLPFWTEVWGWSLVLTNMLSLPLMNIVGMFLEEAEEKDYLGIFSFVLLTYIVAPFQAYAAVKGFMEHSEGPWFRTPKTGHITDVFKRGKFYRWLSGMFPGREVESAQQMGFDQSSVSSSVINVAFSPAYSRSPSIRPRSVRRRWAGNAVLSGLLTITIFITSLTPQINLQQDLAFAAQTEFKTLAQTNIEDAVEAPSDSDRIVTKEEKLKNATAEEITTARLVTQQLENGDTVEYIFQPHPEVRIKNQGREMTIVTDTIDGKIASPTRARIFGDREIVYENIIKNVDLRYKINSGLISEEFVVKDREAAKALGNIISQKIETVKIKVVSPDPSVFGFFDESGREIIKFSSPFAKDDDGQVTNDLHFSLEKSTIGHILTKTLGESAREWMFDPLRAYPVIVDPSIIVTGGVTEAETSYGSLQRRVVYMPSAVSPAWYAFASDGNDASYYRSTDGSTWSSAQDMDAGDADNYNPSVSVSGNHIVAFWIDDSSETVEGLRFDTTSAFPHTLGTLCTGSSQGTIGSTFMVTVAAVSTTEAVVAYSDTGADSEFNVFDVTGLDGTCAAGSFTTDLTPGNITFGSGVTASDRPVLTTLSSTRVAMVFQDGNLSYSELDTGADEWVLNNLTIASVTDSLYSIVSDQAATPKVWVLSTDANTDTNFYTCCTADFVENQIDSDAGANNDDGDSDIDMFCPAEDNCKFVYTDSIDADPDLVFVDCNDTDCDTPVTTVLDSDIGAANDQAGASIYCVSDGDAVVSDNCKIAYGDDMDGAVPSVIMIDCTNDEDCSTNGNSGDIDTDLGTSSAILHTSIFCPSDTDCKIVYNDSGLADVFFVDCSSATCNTRDVITQLDSSAAANPKNDIYCVAADNCKVIYHDDNVTGGCADANSLCFVDCGATTCAVASATFRSPETEAGATTNQVPMAIDCVGGDTDCKIVYGDTGLGDTIFLDCAIAACCTSADCTSDGTKTAVDTSGHSGSIIPQVDLDCVAADDCKFTYRGDVAASNDLVYFVDCDNATCTSGSVIEMPGPRYEAAIQCLTSVNCKFAYYEGTAGSNPTVKFADCDVTNCFPTVVDDSDPFTSVTAAEGVSLTYNSGNSSLYASILMDTTDQAYYKSSLVSSISWGSQTSWAFSPSGSLNQISAIERIATETELGVVLNNTTGTGNFEFATVPERTLLLLGLAPFLPKIFKKKKSKTFVYAKK